MARGLSRDQIGLTEEMIRSFGETVFKMSHNYQVRRGDPVRLLDWEQIEAQREGAGLTDAQIADRLGLTRDQVLVIRTLEERRRFRGQQHYLRLLELGGGRRFRQERFVPHEERFRYSDEAMRLRRSLVFDPDRVVAFTRAGHWREDTVRGLLDSRAGTSPDNAALAGAAPMDNAALLAAVAAAAGGLAAAGLRPGDVAAVAMARTADAVVGYLAVLWLGGVALPLAPGNDGAATTVLLKRAGARLVLADARAAKALDQRRGDVPTFAAVLDRLPAAAALPDGLPRPVAADPMLLLAGAEGRLALHNGHTALSAARLAARALEIGAGTTLGSAMPLHGPVGLFALHLALVADAAFVLDGAADLTVDGLDGGDAALRVSEHVLAPAALTVHPGDATLRLAPGIEARRAEDGSLELRGPQLAAGYVDDPAAIEAAFTADGWFRSGVTAPLHI